MKTIEIKETRKDLNGLRTTISVNTEDANVARKILFNDADKCKEENKEKSNNKSEKNGFIGLLINTFKSNDLKEKTKEETNKMLPAPKNNKKLTKKSIRGKAKINHKTNNLNEDLINISNYNSFNGKRGDILKKEYEECRRKIEFSSLSNKQKKKLLDKLYKMYEPILRYDSQWYSPMVSGPAGYPQAKMDAIYERMMDANSKFVSWWRTVEKQIDKLKEFNNDRLKEPNNDRLKEFNDELNRKKIEEIKDGFNRFYSQLVKNPENKHLASLAERYVIKALKVDTKLYKELFEKLNKIVNYRKNTNMYKAYKQVLDGNLSSEKIQKKDAEDNKVLFTCSDYTVRKVKIQAGDRIGIEFMFRPKPQLIYALKKRGFTWHSLKGLWVCKPEKFDLEWAKNISKQYEKYIM